jgi:hypothetical protein
MFRYLRAFIGAAAIFIGAADAAVESQVPNGRTVSVANNSGGSVVEFAIKAASYRKSRTRLQITGRCDSACTLYLTLPRTQLCVAPGAFFRFHAPQASSQSDAKTAQNFMMRKYPGWVRQWITARGGLSRRLITMDYRYASKFVPSCTNQAAAR